jgi:hypothetical protein
LTARAHLRQNTDMKSIRCEVDAEIFDPTGQGVEVVDAEFARKLVRERDEASRKHLQEMRARVVSESLIEVLRRELERARSGSDSLAQVEQMEWLSEVGLVGEFGRFAGEELGRKLAEALLDSRDRVEELEQRISGLKLDAEDDEEETRAGRTLNEGLCAENTRLREIFPKVLEALGYKEVCGSGAAVGFLENIPDIVREEIIRERRLRYEGEGEGRSAALTLSQIAAEVEEYCESRDCTTFDAVRLMKCHLRELEARETRRDIYDSWGG